MSFFLPSFWCLCACTPGNASSCNPASMNVCVCVFMTRYLCEHVYVYISIHKCVCTQVYVHIPIRTCVYPCMTAEPPRVNLSSVSRENAQSNVETHRHVKRRSFFAVCPSQKSLDMHSWFCYTSKQSMLSQMALLDRKQGLFTCVIKLLSIVYRHVYVCMYVHRHVRVHIHTYSELSSRVNAISCIPANVYVCIYICM